MAGRRAPLLPPPPPGRLLAATLTDMRGHDHRRQLPHGYKGVPAPLARTPSPLGRVMPGSVHIQDCWQLASSRQRLHGQLIITGPVCVTAGTAGLHGGPDG